MSPLPSLSAAARSVWAKSHADPAAPNEPTGWLPLYQHLDDSAAVAGRLWDEWVSDAVKRLVAVPFAGDRIRARTLYVWLTALHDVGKASPAFAVQVPRLAQTMTERGLALDPSLYGSDERRLARHELVSYVALREWLRREHGFPAVGAMAYASVLAAHHGLPADHRHIQNVAPNARLIGDGVWVSVREEFLARAAAQHTTPDNLDVWRSTQLPQQVQVLLSGLVIVADWIASSDAFRLCPLSELPTASAEERLESAWPELDFPMPWRPSLPAEDSAELFRDRFILPPGATVRPVQEAMIRVAREVSEPSLIILEAEMGVGKTEAALAAAEILAARFGLGGIFIGLPTQATADGMFSRMLAWADRLQLETPNNVFLARGKAQLNEEYAQLAREAYFRSIGQDRPERRDGRDRPDSVIAHRWFANPKRGPLANLVVGTIDQGLFAGLRSRHLMLRHLALAGKVVIIDEAHAYSTYMNVYLERVVHWLAAYDVPVIILSATLPAARRKALVAAYDEGRRYARAMRRPASDAPERYDMLDGEIRYPSIVVSGGDTPPRIITPEATGRTRSVALERRDDSLETLVALLRDALREGGCTVVIRNTVRRVQDTAQALRAAFPGTPVLVAHSRFLGLDRAAKDAQLLKLFGPPRESTERPDSYIVVASQVVEQSLDIDFDLMVSDLAPIDLLLQRAGRLHRHPRGADESDRPAPVRAPRLVITGVDWETVPPAPVRGSQVVYAPYILYRTLAALIGHDVLRLPDDIPKLVQVVYGTAPLGPDDWGAAIEQARTAFDRDAEKRRRDADVFLLNRIDNDDTASLIGWVHANADDPSDESRGRAAVRDGDETLEVLVLQQNAEGTLQTPAWLPERDSRPRGGIPIPENEPPDRRLTRIVLGCALRLPASMCRGDAIDKHIRELEKTRMQLGLQSWHTSPSLRGELVLVLDENGWGRLGAFALSYSPDTGLEVINA